MRQYLLGLAMLAVLATVNVSFADEECCDEGKCTGTCSVAAAMEQMPKMTYKVGEESTCCSASAEKLAEETDNPVLFVVEEKEYTDKMEAMTSLADASEKFVNNFVTPHTCDVSHTTTLAGKKMPCSDSAKAMAKLMKDAMSEVSMVYKVGDESCHCPVEAKQLAEKSGAKTEFVVDGESTCCSVDARVKMAQAKFKAAVQALVGAHQETEETKPVSTSS